MAISFYLLLVESDNKSFKQDSSFFVIKEFLLEELVLFRNLNFKVEALEESMEINEAFF